MSDALHPTWVKTQHLSKMEVDIPWPPEVCPGRASNSCWGTGIALVPPLQGQQEPALGDSVVSVPMDTRHGSQLRGTVWVLMACSSSSGAGGTSQELEAVAGWMSPLCSDWFTGEHMDVTGGHTLSSTGTLLLRAGGLCCWQPWCSPVNHPEPAWWAMSSKWFAEPPSWVKLECCPVLLNRVR